MVFLRPSYRAVAGHHWVGEARVEFEVIDGTTPAEPTIDELQERLDELTASDLEFKIEGDPDKGRAIKIGDFAAVGCGGTHVHSTNELAGIRVTGIKNKKGRLRVSYEVASPGR
jgi:Ser-tRNA(Ala) deacylase AlaX